MLRPAAVLFAFVSAFVSGSLWGVFAVLTKSVVHRLSDGGWGVFASAELYAWLAVAIGGFGWEQSAFRAGALTAPMPTLQVSQPVVAALLSVAVLGETLDTGRGGMIALAVAALLVAALLVAALLVVATAELARVDADATGRRVAAALDDAAVQTRLAETGSQFDSTVAQAILRRRIQRVRLSRRGAIEAGGALRRVNDDGSVLGKRPEGLL
ncbi:DMT family transporter [Mycobacterium simiae]|uniref:DMT family transporter n=1 Tax=Mycobacterium simiae TaxID=1784 RepID=UPI000A6DC3B2